MARTVYLLCELKSRDLDSRLLVAAHLLNAGLDVVIGQQWTMVQNAATIPKGIFLFKTANRIQAEGMGYVRKHGHVTVAMDEEVLGMMDPTVVGLMTDPRAFNADAFLFQNAQHRSMFEREGPIVGNVRVDLLRSWREFYAAEAAECASRGPYLLINTNYALCNSVWGAQRMYEITTGAWRPDMSVPAIRAYMESWPVTEQRNFEAMVGYLRLLVPRLGGLRLVIRPHPAENHEVWRSVAGAEILTGTNPIPWIMGATLTVHTNSTTGLEAALLECPSLNLNPDPDSALSRSFATNNAPFQASTPEEAFHATHRALAGESLPNATAWLPHFPDNAAALVAAEIAARAIDGPRVAGWPRARRQPVETEKFSATFDEVSARLGRLSALMGGPQLIGGTLDDSLFWFGRSPSGEST